VATGPGHGDGGVPDGGLVARLVDATFGKGDQGLDEVKAEVRSTMGDAALVDCVTVISAFHMANRLTNATGSPIDPFMVEATKVTAAVLGANEFLSRVDAST
jgi:hypothetical protein